MQKLSSDIDSHLYDCNVNIPCGSCKTTFCKCSIRLNTLCWELVKLAFSEFFVYFLFYMMHPRDLSILFDSYYVISFVYLTSCIMLFVPKYVDFIRVYVMRKQTSLWGYQEEFPLNSQYFLSFIKYLCYF